MTNFTLEVCANSATSCLNAELGGAHRVELCASMPEGGTTPSYGEIALARELIKIKLHVIIRPRGGDFLYTDLELRAMLRDIDMAKQLGADGIVIGCLTPSGDVDVELCSKLIARAGAMSVTFHRAFDRCRNPYKALEAIVALGCQRVLTSGQRATAEQGIPLLRELVTQAANRISIMPGSGINETNIVRIARETGAHEFHSSARHTVASAMLYRNSGISMGGEVTINEDEISQTSVLRVKQTIQLLHNL